MNNPNPYGITTSSGNPWGLGSLVFNPSTTVFTPNPTVSFPNTGGYNPNGGYVPNVTANASGIQVQTTTLDKILGSVLSGMALIKSAPYVPTTVQPQQEPTVIYQQPVGGGTGFGGGDGTAAGKVENWLKNNTGVALMGAAALGLYLLKPPTRSR